MARGHRRPVDRDRHPPGGLAWPGIGAVSLAIVVGAYLAAYGVVLVVSAAKAPSASRSR